MESLTNLKILYLDCCNLKNMTIGIFHRLTHLQELTLPCHVVHPTDVEGLKQLELFDGRLNSVSDLNQLIKSQQSEGRLRSEHIILNELGEVFGYDEYYPPCKVVHFGDDSLADSPLGVDENLLPQDIEELLFEGSGLSCCLLHYFPMLNNAKDLKKCDIAVEKKIECIMRLSSTEEEQQSRGVPFQSLEDLSLYGLPNFIGLLKWEGREAVSPLPHGAFSQLKMLQIYEIIRDDGRDPTANSSVNVTLLKLKDFYLKNLSKLTSICKGMMICESIESISILKCTVLKKFPLHLDGQPSAPRFLKDKKIRREEKQWWE
ncbi:putative disease resistance protein [Forsythia ovata]|uniref:Disease resistance protein n=1 Tax=Forsythia ovata TaxID=205694 RepID=A0ABD1V194_9LAMI